MTTTTRTRPYVPRQPKRAAPPIPVMRFNPAVSGLERWLGPLEADLMDLLYDADGPRTVKQIWRLNERDLGYTTVMTTMVRLAEKGLLARRRNGMAYTYWPTCTREEFIELQLAAVRRSVEEG